jgi:medium-chain acyl-[acyl-carrier-protein] hydrolase
MTKIRVVNKWIPYRRPNRYPRLRLFCFPYAGGSASVFRAWVNSFPQEIDICPIQYPGREKRIIESPFTSIEPLIDELANVLLPELDIPFAFFGHSLGALISFELARRLQRKGISPVQLFVSSYHAPGIAKRKAPMHLLPDTEFVERLREYNGTPDAVLQNSELMKVLLPTLRADFALHETYVYSSGVPLTCPISAFGGIKDLEVKSNDLKLWKEQTIDSFKLQMFQGDHFYIHNNDKGLINAIVKNVTIGYRKSFMNQEYRNIESN